MNADGRIGTAVSYRLYDQIFDAIVQLALETCALGLGRGLRHDVNSCSQAVFGAALCVQIVWLAKNGLRGGLNNIAFVASLRINVVAAQIKYSDTGLLPEALIELPALPDEITGGCRCYIYSCLSPLGVHL